MSATLPAITVAPSITCQAAAPALVSGEVGAEHVGCTRPVLTEHLGWMSRHPRWRERVIEASQKRRFAAPSDVIASMRDRYQARRVEAPVHATVATAAEPTVDDLLQELGHARRPVANETRHTGKRGAR